MPDSKTQADLNSWQNGYLAGIEQGKLQHVEVLKETLPWNRLVHEIYLEEGQDQIIIDCLTETGETFGVRYNQDHEATIAVQTKEFHQYLTGFLHGYNRGDAAGMNAPRRCPQCGNIFRGVITCQKTQKSDDA